MKFVASSSTSSFLISVAGLSNNNLLSPSLAFSSRRTAAAIINGSSRRRSASSSSSAAAFRSTAALPTRTRANDERFYATTTMKKSDSSNTSLLSSSSNNDNNNNEDDAVTLTYTPISSISPLITEARTSYTTHFTHPFKFRMAQLDGIERLIIDNYAALSKTIELDLGQGPMYAEGMELTGLLGRVSYAFCCCDAQSIPHRRSLLLLRLTQVQRPAPLPSLYAQLLWPNA
jgi:hypothetical protein